MDEMVIATFMHRGDPTAAASLQAEFLGNGLYRMKMEGTQFNYAGTTLPDSQDDSYEWVVAAKNRKTQQVACAPVTFVSFKPEIGGEHSEATEDAESANMTALEKREELTLKFGSRKKMKATKSRKSTKLAENGDPTALTFFKNTSSLHPDEESNDGSSVADGADQRQTTSLALPKFNPNATRPEDVYDVADIVSDDCLSCLIDEANDALEKLRTKQVIPDIYPYVASFLNKFNQSNDDHSWYRCLALYLNYLIRFSSFVGQRKRIDVSGATEARIPEALVYKLFERYTVPAKGHRCVSPVLRDSLVSHVVLLLVVLSGFKTTVKELLIDAKISLKRLKTIARLLGCKVANDTTVIGGCTITLAGPPTPKPLVATPRRGKKTLV